MRKDTAAGERLQRGCPAGSAEVDLGQRQAARSRRDQLPAQHGLLVRQHARAACPGACEGAETLKACNPISYTL